MGKVMRLAHEGHTYAVSVDSQGEQVTLKVEKDGVTLPSTDARVQALEPWLLIHLDGRSYRCVSARDKEGVWVSVDGRSSHLKFKAAAGREDHAPVTSGTDVRAPMTGTVIKIMVEPGAVVAPGSLVAAMEAMKMEYRLEAQIDGKVARVLCKPGDMVDVGALLVEISPLSPA